MLQVKTRTGVHEVPTKISERAKWWAETLHDVTRLEEVHGLLESALREAYAAGQSAAALQFLVGFRKQKGEVVDVEWTEVTEHPQGDMDQEDSGGVQGATGSEHSESAAISQADGSAEPTLVDRSLSGSDQESSGSI